MIICFKCSRETKEQLDHLVSAGGFSDLSEAIAVAIGNQMLLTKSASSSPLVLEDRAKNDLTHTMTKIGTTEEASSPETIRVPSIFQLKPGSCPGLLAPFPQHSISFSAQDRVSQAHWIFGQHNKLLPAKASCRAIANLLSDTPGGLEAGEVARLVANYAGELAVSLQAIDKKFDRQRDDTLSTAFPGRKDPDKGRIRYANQFVAGVTKQGQLTGLLVDLALLNKLSPDSRKIALTDAGWKFAMMPNPVMDGREENPNTKLSSEERAFLARHISDNVIVERSAYLQILSAIHSGHDSPEGLRAAFNEMEKETEKNNLYFSTQRAGAISRMADLGLLRRDRNGTRVSYAITDDGVEFLNNL